MQNTYGASAQAQLFGIPTIRSDEINPGTVPVVGFNVDKDIVPPAVGSVSDVVQTNVDLSAAVDSMVEQANSLGKVAVELVERSTRSDASQRDLDKATKEGREAFANGTPVSANPYTDRDRKWAWQVAWKGAEYAKRGSP